MRGLSAAGLIQWHADRARQALIGVVFHTLSYPHILSRGEFMRRCNNGIALRTFRAAKAVR